MSETNKPSVPANVKLPMSVSQYDNTERRIVYQSPLNKRNFSVTASTFETIQFAIPRNGLCNLKESYFHVPNVTFDGAADRNAVFDYTAGHLQLFNRITLYSNSGSQVINIENAHLYHSIKGCLVDRNTRLNKSLLNGGGVEGDLITQDASGVISSAVILNSETGVIANGATYQSTNKKKYTVSISLWDILLSQGCNSDISPYFPTTALDGEMRLELQLNQLNNACIHNNVTQLNLNDCELRLSYTQHPPTENSLINSTLNFIVPNVKHYVDSIILPNSATRTDFNISFRSPYSSLSAVFVHFSTDTTPIAGYNACNSSLPTLFGLQLSLAGRNQPMLYIEDEKMLYAHFIATNNGVASSYGESGTSIALPTAAMSSNVVSTDEIDRKCIFGMDMRNWMTKTRADKFNGSNIVAQEFSLNGYFNITSDLSAWQNKTIQANIYLVYDQEIVIQGGEMATRF